MICQNWVDQEIRLSDCDGTDGFVLEDFIEFVALQVIPYGRRLQQTGYITSVEYTEFILDLRGKADELRQRLRLPEDPPNSK